MFRPRVIPALLLRNLGLVKTVRFKKPRYIGDPINAVKIFNDFKADEIVFLDILASRANSRISLEFVKKVGAEANMPFSVGGGIRTIADIKEIIGAGAEKVILNTSAFEDPDFVKRAVDEFGSSTIVISIDIKKTLLKGPCVFTHCGTKNTQLQPLDYAKQVEALGAGEILLNYIDYDGLMTGYNIDLIQEIAQNLTIPLVAIGGAGKIEHFKSALDEGCASAVAAGSMFVYHGPRNAVLINYPSVDEMEQLAI